MAIPVIHINQEMIDYGIGRMTILRMSICRISNGR